MLFCFIMFFSLRVVTDSRLRTSPSPVLHFSCCHAGLQMSITATCWSTRQDETETAPWPIARSNRNELPMAIPPNADDGQTHSDRFRCSVRLCASDSLLFSPRTFASAGHGGEHARPAAPAAIGSAQCRAQGRFQLISLVDGRAHIHFNCSVHVFVHAVSAWVQMMHQLEVRLAGRDHRLAVQSE